MIHFKPSAFFRTLAFVDVMSPSHTAAPISGIVKSHGRADHARMLAHAAQRRMSAQDRRRSEERGYWKACAPAAVVKAAAIRSEPGFARLPG